MAEQEKKQITLEQAKAWRLTLRIAFFAIAFVAPVLITGFRFHLFTQYSHAKLSIIGLLVILIISWRFKKKLSEWINSWEDSNVAKWIFVAIGRVWPFLLITIILAVINWSASKIMGDVLFCIEWACACELVAYILLYPFEMKMDYIIKRMIRKNERKADYKEAVAEMKAEEGNNDAND